jgi:short-subunit dehydrogenase
LNSLLALLLQAVTPHMVAAGRGRIINIGSLTGFTPVPLRGIYSATKGAVLRLSDALRIELGMIGVQVGPCSAAAAAAAAAVLSYATL